MHVPPHVRALREDILARQNGRVDDVEFTFRAGQWNHLGEATLMNRIKSHQDVGERWYPDLLAKIREQSQSQSKDVLNTSQTDGKASSIANANTAIEAH